MKIAYGTYAMPTVPLEDAFPALGGIGYDGVEICISPKHTGAMPDQMDAARRAVLKRTLADNGLGVPALFLTGSIWAEDAEQHQSNLEHLRVCAQLARDLGLPETPVLAMGIGGKRDQWDSIRGRLVELLRDCAAVAEEEGFVLAGEAHCGAAVYNPDRAIWLFETVDSPRVRMHFDIVHMFLAGEREEEAVKALVPYTAHTHITDARRQEDGSFELLLLGHGELDAVAYMRAMKEAGWDDFITLEVSMMVWGKEGYDPIAAAEESYRAITDAFAGAGVERG
jgi:sugar phosphate isomerase/epimerase